MGKELISADLKNLTSALDVIRSMLPQQVKAWVRDEIKGTTRTLIKEVGSKEGIGYSRRGIRSYYSMNSPYMVVPQDKLRPAFANPGAPIKNKFPIFQFNKDPKLLFVILRASKSKRSTEDSVTPAIWDALVNIQKQRQELHLSFIGTSQAVWLKAAKELGIDVQAPAYVQDAMRNLESRRTTTPNVFTQAISEKGGLKLALETNLKYQDFLPTGNIHGTINYIYGRRMKGIAMAWAKGGTRFIDHIFKKYKL